ncbi:MULTISPECIES: M20/M25/M40 family metallo-hydrolase [Corynebacterium]|uniref:M20/M25/M40 family metallo-hydrolase n=1 Tax=Corynebacterium TaxID=1716 RepID=UPI00257A801F|nr:MULTISPECIES: M20/M25/M40 family metallo-hydrolase [Corynebacterium]
MDIQAENLELLRGLIRNRCVNDGTPGSGHEVRNADLLEEYFQGSGAQVQRFEPLPGRVSIAFAVPGSDPSAEPLTLLGHIDVVPVDEDKWIHEPFGAEIVDGVLYGRGALDMLFITAAQATAVREIAIQAQQGNPPRGTVTFVALADEENGGGLGARWIAENHPEAFSWKNCLSEMGGSHLPVRDGSDALVINVGEKGVFQRRLHASGDTGHGSMPYKKHSSILALADAAQRIGSFEPPAAFDHMWARFVEAFHFDPATTAALVADAADDEAYETFGDLTTFALSFSHNSIALTGLRAGSSVNVIPSHAYLNLDIRALPGDTADSVDAMIRAALGDLSDTIEIERLTHEPPSTSPAEGPLWEAMVDTYGEFFPQASVIPVYAAGGSDLRFGRRMGGIGYGFSLHARGRFLAEVNEELHSHDECIHLEDVDLTLAAYRGVCKRFVY